MSDSDMALNASGAPDLAAELRSALPALLPDWLGSQRWFADKGCQITGVELDALDLGPAAAEQYVLAIARLGFAEGPDTRYFLPFAVVAAKEEENPLSVLTSGGRALAVCEASSRPEFGRWLLELLMRDAGDERGRWQCEVEASAREALALAIDQSAWPLGAEQSNTSLRFGEVALAKIIRRLQPAPNPDEEVLQILGQLGFDHVPKFFGSAAWRAPDDTRFPVVLVQGYVANVGDGWTWMLEHLADVASGRLEPAAESLRAAVRLLGRRTAEMHKALSRAVSPEFSPEPVTYDAIEANRNRVRTAAAAAVKLIARSQDDAPAPERLSATALAAIEAVANLRATGFADEITANRIRVHGDYHLGQVLRTVHDDWVIVDFEGEPARPVAERREKVSVLKDVAGMLRSFSYARGVAAKAAADVDDRSLERLRQWEHGAREAFLQAYRDEIRRGDRVLAPLDDAAFARAVSAWETDKALYEIAYEAGNRPDWLWLPLASLLPAAGDQPSGLAGAAPA